MLTSEKKPPHSLAMNTNMDAGSLAIVEALKANTTVVTLRYPPRVRHSVLFFLTYSTVCTAAMLQEMCLSCLMISSNAMSGLPPGTATPNQPRANNTCFFSGHSCFIIKKHSCELSCQAFSWSDFLSGSGLDSERSIGSVHFLSHGVTILAAFPLRWMMYWLRWHHRRVYGKQA